MPEGAFYTLLTPTIAKYETILHFCKSKLSLYSTHIKKDNNKEIFSIKDRCMIMFVQSRILIKHMYLFMYCSTVACIFTHFYAAYMLRKGSLMDQILIYKYTKS